MKAALRAAFICLVFMNGDSSKRGFGDQIPTFFVQVLRHKNQEVSDGAKRRHSLLGFWFVLATFFAIGASKPLISAVVLKRKGFMVVRMGGASRRPSLPI